MVHLLAHDLFATHIAGICSNGMLPIFKQVKFIP